MGFEIKLLVGKACHQSPVFEKDEEGIYQQTAHREQWFRVDAEVDLCKCGSTSQLNKLYDATKHTDPNHHYFLYGLDGHIHFTEDLYGKKLQTVPIHEVIQALKVDASNDNYRRFPWALALLKSMEDDPEGFEVILYGH